MADLSKITLPDGTTYDLKDLDAADSIESTGGNGVRLKKRDGSTYSAKTKINTQDLERPDSLRGLNDVTLQSLVSTTRANRLAFLPADQIIIEQTIDGGTTWTDAGVSDATKLALFSETRPSVSLPRINDAPNLLCGLRITFTAMKYDVPEGTAETEKYNYWNSNYVKSPERYCQLKEFYFWLSSNNNSIGIKVQRATGAKSTTWIDIFSDDDFFMTGWSGCDYVRFAQNAFGGGANQTGQPWNYRIILMTKGANGTSTMGTSTAAQSISEIRGYGDSVWNSSNQYMANDHMYEKDANKNVTFPAQVTATQFNGKATSATALATAGTIQTNLDSTSAATYTSGGNITPGVTGTLSVANGGTNATTAEGARTNLGLGTAATHDVETTLANDSNLPTGAAVTAAINNAVDFGTVGSNQNPVYFNNGFPSPTAFTFGVDDDQNVQVSWEGNAPEIVIPTDTALAINKGGTGATTAAGARTNLGLGSAATYNVVSAVQDDENLVTNGAVKRYVDGLVDGTVTSHDISGSVLSFEAVNLQPVKSMVLNLEPYQNLNGYSSPWVGGAGKNLFDNQWMTKNAASGVVTISFNGTETHVTTDGSGRYMGTYNNQDHDLPAGTYYIKFKIKSGATLTSYSRVGLRKRANNNIVNSVPLNASTLSYAITITITEDCYFSYIGNGADTGSGQATDITIYDIMVSTTDSAFEPYENICPISGYDSVNVVRSGKNLIDLDAFTVGGIGNSGLPDSTSGRIVDTEPVTIDDSLSYTISAQYAESAYDLRIIYSVFNDNTLVRRIANVSIKNTSATLNVSGGNKLYICLYCDQSHPIVKSNVSELQLEIGTTKTAYTPFTGNTTYPISLSSAGTVYGGTLDVTSGVLTVTHKHRDMGDLTWGTNDGSYFYSSTLTDKALGITNLISDQYQTVNASSVSGMSDGQIKGAAGAVAIYVKDTRYTVASDFKAAMSGHDVVYELATPITYHLTPTEVTTLLGENTIWTDSEGTIAVTYKDIVAPIKYTEVGKLGTAAVRNVNDKVVPDDSLPTGKAVSNYTPSHAQNGIYYGTCATAAGTAAKVIELVDPTGFELKVGVMIAVAFSASNTADNETFNVEGTGAIGISYIKGSRYTGHTNTITGHASYIMYYIYDGTYWCFVNNSSNYSNNSNTVPAAQCETAAATAAKAATCTNHTLTANTYCHFNIRYANTAKSALTMNVDSSGAKPIYINGTASSSSNYTLPAGTYIAFYNGTNWYFNTNGSLPGTLAIANGGTGATDAATARTNLGLATEQIDATTWATVQGSFTVQTTATRISASAIGVQLYLNIKTTAAMSGNTVLFTLNEAYKPLINYGILSVRSNTSPYPEVGTAWVGSNGNVTLYGSLANNTVYYITGTYFI